MDVITFLVVTIFTLALILAFSIYGRHWKQSPYRDMPYEEYVKKQNTNLSIKTESR